MRRMIDGRRSTLKGSWKECVEGAEWKTAERGKC